MLYTLICNLKSNFVNSMYNIYLAKISHLYEYVDNFV